ncbi:MAG: hypothetical protein JO197_17490 [Acidobacteria bacterium]|nr:hypothetical protein [Acidobacteriota bacterium]MBV9478381.1 hypothetical protein [Acidobacteriota bacterium]
MTRACLPLIALTVLSCRHVDTRVPPPPPVATDVHGDGPAAVPDRIAAFLANRNELQVTLYRFDEQDASNAHGRHVAESAVLSADAAAELAAVLTRPESYTDAHFGCGDAGIGVRLSRGDASMDLLVDLICRHIYDARSGEEVGYLSTAAQDWVVQLAQRVHAER